MMLGELLQKLDDETFAAGILASLGNLALMVEVDKAAESFRESAPAYAVEAVRRFEAFAGAEDWVDLMGTMQGSDDPGAACLRHVLAWSLRADRAAAAGCGSCGDETATRAA